MPIIKLTRRQGQRKGLPAGRARPLRGLSAASVSSLHAAPCADESGASGQHMIGGRAATIQRTLSLALCIFAFALAFCPGGEHRGQRGAQLLLPGPLGHRLRFIEGDVVGLLDEDDCERRPGLHLPFAPPPVRQVSPGTLHARAPPAWPRLPHACNRWRRAAKRASSASSCSSVILQGRERRERKGQRTSDSCAVMMLS